MFWGLCNRISLTLVQLQIDLTLYFPRRSSPFCECLLLLTPPPTITFISIQLQCEE
jgi:hypothetical protein